MINAKPQSLILLLFLKITYATANKLDYEQIRLTNLINQTHLSHSLPCAHVNRFCSERYCFSLRIKCEDSNVTSHFHLPNVFLSL